MTKSTGKRRRLPFHWTLAQRLEHYTDKTGSCWVWTGCGDKNGYGVMKVDGVQKRMHRIVWEQSHGPIPPGMEICHRCDNPSCIRESHLFLGSHAENMADMRRKGRWVPPPINYRQGAKADG
jgi:hypothetical protein